MTDDLRVVRVGRERRDDVVDTLCDAFHDYPVMRFVLRDVGADYDAHLAELVAYFTESRLIRGWPVLALRDGERWCVVALINPPAAQHPAGRSAELDDRYPRLGTKARRNQ